MLGNAYPMTFHVPGTLAANVTLRFKMPFGATLLHVSAVAGNDSDATLQIGTSTDVDGILTATVIGDSGTPAEFERADFDGALLADPGWELPRLADGDIVQFLLDYDGSSGTAAQDVTIVATFLEG